MLDRKPVPVVELEVQASEQVKRGVQDRVSGRAAEVEAILALGDGLNLLDRTVGQTEVRVRSGGQRLVPRLALG